MSFSGFSILVNDNAMKLSISVCSHQAMFEVLTSEASYLKSLNILVNHFMNECLEKVDHMQEEKVLDKQQFHFLFGGLPKIKSVSER